MGLETKVVAALCVRNEEWILPRTLDILNIFCDKIIILDDSSTDKTKEICLSYDSVDYEDWPPRDNMILRQEGLRKQRNIDRVKEYNPDYVFFLDADEIPTPNIINFLTFISSDPEASKNNLWTFPWYHLWQDEDHYRVDSFRKGASHVVFDPFNGGQRKNFLIKYNPDWVLSYDISKHKSVPMSPSGIPTPHGSCKDIGIIHYGKIRPSFVNGEKNKYYAQIEAQTQNYNYKDRLAHHEACRSEKTLKLKKLDPKFKDWSQFGNISEVNYDAD